MHLDEAQGADEERTEMYLKYFEGVPQAATPRFAKSVGGVPAPPEAGRRGA